MFVSGTETCRPFPAISLAQIRLVSERVISRVWRFSGFRDRMIFLRSIVKLVAFAEAPSILTHEG